jgi:2-methylcitrate dehydratase PrpD
MEPLQKSLASFVCETSYSALPQEAVKFAKLCLLDLIGVAIAGSLQPTSRIARELICSAPQAGEAGLWVSDQRLSLRSAAFLNAVQGHAIDMDDGHRFANGHPGVVTIPVAVALAEKEGLSGQDLLTAIVIGYEMFIRLGRSLNPELLGRGFHTTATVGVFAAAAAAAKLLGLNPDQTAKAFSLAGLQSAGLLEALSSGEMGKSFQVGKSAQNGLLAAQMAQRGADGPEKIFEGGKGFFKAFSGQDCDVEGICHKLGRDFHIGETYFKRHAACRHIHSPLDAAGELLAENPIEPEAIKSIDIETYSIAKNLTGHVAGGDSELAAKFSTPVAIGLLLIFGRTDALAFSKDKISDPRVRAVAQKVSISVNPERDKHYPGQRSAEVRITAQDKTFRKEVIVPKGEPEFPLSQKELVDKFETNAGLAYLPDTMHKLRETIMNIENLSAGDLPAALKVPDK